MDFLGQQPNFRDLEADPACKSLFPLVVAARSSDLSKAQVQEIYHELLMQVPSASFSTLWIETTGDLHLEISLKTMEKTDFFTKEIDLLLLKGTCRIAVHSAKDLPDPLPKGLSIVALSKGVDPSDVLVLRVPGDIADLPYGARVGVSSQRREAGVRYLREDLQCIDIRGTIHKRLDLLKRGELDAVAMAKAALIRLNLSYLPTLFLPISPAPLQGKLAVVAREEDEQMHALFSLLDTRLPL